jgi:hypothetical protein
MALRRMGRDFWDTTFGAATIGFELSCVALWPAAYVNHTLIAKAWESRRRSIVG